MIDALFLDAGGVLVHPDTTRVAACLAEIDVLVDPLRMREAHYRGMAAVDRVQAAPEEFADYQHAYTSQLGLTGDVQRRAVAALASLFSGGKLWDEVLPGAAEGLAAIAATGIPIVIVSNADGTVAEVLTSTGLLQVGPGPGVPVRAIIDSGVVGVAKPDPAIFRHALDAAGATPERTLHVGDAYHYDVRGARAAGIRPVLYDPLGLRDDVDCERITVLAAVTDLFG